MLLKSMIGVGCSVLMANCWAADGQVIPPRCSCSEPQELSDALKPTRAAPLIIWNCMCGGTQCVIAHASTQAGTEMNCLPGAVAKTEEPAAPPKVQQKRPRDAQK